MSDDNQGFVIGYAAAPVKAGYPVEIDHIDDYGVKWLRPMNDDGLVIEGPEGEVRIVISDAFNERAAGVALYDAAAGESVRGVIGFTGAFHWKAKDAE